MEIMESVTFDFRHCFRGFCEGGVRPGDFREGLATRVMSTDEGDGAVGEFRQSFAWFWEGWAAKGHKGRKRRRRMGILENVAFDFRHCFRAFCSGRVRSGFSGRFRVFCWGSSAPTE
jgi:hypothetical protein